MITKVTKDNKGLYRALFEKATDALYGDDPTEEEIITSLDDYFVQFKDLVMVDEVFAILPLDEPYFEIDADTRVITVPSEFKKNGISVKGDQIAEIVFFTIDRYYDTTDLFDDDVKIYIQWEAPNGDKGLYPAIFKDITILSDKGKMLFGWTIDNKITKNSGTMKFSVRFIRTMLNADNQQEIVFSLSTLTANAIVNPGLDFEFNGDIPAVEVIDNRTIVMNRIKDSAYIDNDDAYSAEVPSFLVNIPTTADVFATVEEDGQTYLFVDLKEVESALQYQFVANATSDDGGVITYEWYRADATAGKAGDAISGNITYVETADTVWDASKTYYTKSTASGVDSYEPYLGFEDGEEIPTGEDAETYYEKASSITATRTGNYWVIAKNRKGRASKTLESNVVRIPGPEALSVAVDETLTIDENTGDYQVYLDNEGAFELEVTGSTARLGSDAGVGDKITYTWSEGDLEQPQNAVTNNGVANSYSAAVVEASRKLYDETFKVTVIASRNGDTTAPIEKTFRVTSVAQVPTAVAHDREATIVSGTPVTISVDTATTGIISDELTYQWYRITADAEDEDFLIENATGSTLEVDAAGAYYCLVTNHVNGSSATTARPVPGVAADRDKYTQVSSME